MPRKPSNIVRTDDQLRIVVEIAEKARSTSQGTIEVDGRLHSLTPMSDWGKRKSVVSVLPNVVKETESCRRDDCLTNES